MSDLDAAVAVLRETADRLARLEERLAAAVAAPAGVYADGCLDVRRACEFSGIGRSELFDLMRSGSLEYTTNGTKRLIPRKALVALLESRRVAAGAGRASR